MGVQLFYVTDLIYIYHTRTTFAELVENDGSVQKSPICDKCKSCFASPTQVGDAK